MDRLAGLASSFGGGGGDDKPQETKPTGNESQPSNSELLASAKCVAAAAQAAMNKESDKIDKAKAADSAGDLLDAASRYGKLDESKGIGKYVDQAGDYLHKYGSSQSATTTHGSGTAPASGGAPTTEGKEPAQQPSGGEKEEEKEGGSKFGDAFKMAQGFMK